MSRPRVLSLNLTVVFDGAMVGGSGGDRDDWAAAANARQKHMTLPLLRAMVVLRARAERSRATAARFEVARSIAPRDRGRTIDQSALFVSSRVAAHGITPLGYRAAYDRGNLALLRCAS